jgi:hypothetical protein
MTNDLHKIAAALRKVATTYGALGGSCLTCSGLTSALRALADELAPPEPAIVEPLQSTHHHVGQLPPVASSPPAGFEAWWQEHVRKRGGQQYEPIDIEDVRAAFAAGKAGFDTWWKRLAMHPDQSEINLYDATSSAYGAGKAEGVTEERERWANRLAGLPDEVTQAVAELPDEDSPPDKPRELTVRDDELRGIVSDAIQEIANAE